MKEEPNSWIHSAAIVCVVVAGFVFRISSMEWIAVTLCIGFVFALEIINSAIENLADFVSPQKHELIKKVKDLSAAAVLVTAIMAVIIAFIIFIPKIAALCSKY
jgi:diacylglycerol kinase